MTQPAPSHSSPGRVAAIVGGAIAGLVAFGLVVAGAVLLYGNARKDHDGYVSTGSDRFHTRTYALATDDLDVNTDAPGWVTGSSVLGHIRLKATSHGGKPVFVGIAPTKDVNAYLRGTSHATVTDVNYSPFRASYRTHGGRAPAPPVAQRFWTASATGDGTQKLEWKVRDGNWSVVVMNADGSANVDAGVSAGADAPWLATAGWGSLGGGVLLMAIAGGLVFVGVRRPRSDREPVGLVPAAA
ncbi:MAG: hypothetical protein QOH72_5154 [Solirubrobacteraceae bacterium]|jgi:hypothetical protein|nr:hypothetical protein [Solirubrobacteraceae bacterium]